MRFASVSPRPPLRLSSLSTAALPFIPGALLIPAALPFIPAALPCIPAALPFIPFPFPPPSAPTPPHPLAALGAHGHGRRFQPSVEWEFVAEYGSDYMPVDLPPSGTLQKAFRGTLVLDALRVATAITNIDTCRPSQWRVAAATPQRPGGAWRLRSRSTAYLLVGDLNM